MVINRNLKYGTRAAECYKGHINYSDIDESLKSLEARKSESDDIKLSSKRRRKLPYDAIGRGDGGGRLVDIRLPVARGWNKLSTRLEATVEARGRGVTGFLGVPRDLRAAAVSGLSTAAGFGAMLD